MTQPTAGRATTATLRKTAAAEEDLRRARAVIDAAKARAADPSAEAAAAAAAVPAWRKPKPQIIRPATPTFDDEDGEGGSGGGGAAGELEAAVLVLQARGLGSDDGRGGGVRPR